MRNTNWFKSAFQIAFFFGAYLMFAVVGSVVSVLCFLPAMVFRSAGARRIGQGLIHRLFAFFVGYVRMFGLVDVDASALTPLREARGVIIVANHPSLLDAVFMVSALPRAICLMKGSLARNIVLSGTSRLAGYIHNESGLGLVKLCGERLREGSNLLIFPEGTRTVGNQLHPFKMGFALVSVLTGAPVQTVIVEFDTGFMGKGWPFFKRPVLPMHYTLRLGKRFEPLPGMDVKEFGGMVEDYFNRPDTKPTSPLLSNKS